MAGIITTGNHPRRLLPGIRDFYGWQYAQYPTEYDKIATIKTSDKRYEDVIGMAGMGLAQMKFEAQSLSYDDFKQGFASRFVPIVYAKGFVISKEAMDDDLYAPKIAEIGAKHMSKSMHQTKETIVANVLSNGFGTTAFNSVGADGLSLFNTAHLCAKSALTFQNELSVAAALSEASLEQACIDIAGLIDDAGLKIQVLPERLIISRNDMFNARRILGSPLQSDTANNNINVLKDQDYLPGGIHVNHFITSTTNDAWYIITNASENGIILMMREDIEFDADNDFDTKNAKFSAIERYVAYWADPRGVYGSAGA